MPDGRERASAGSTKVKGQKTNPGLLGLICVANSECHCGSEIAWVQLKAPDKKGRRREGRKGKRRHSLTVLYTTQREGIAEEHTLTSAVRQWLPALVHCPPAWFPSTASPAQSGRQRAAHTVI